MVQKDQLIKIKNRTNGTAGYKVPDLNNLHRNFAAGEVKEVTAEEVNGVMTVTAWTPGVMPEPVEPEEPEAELSVWDELDAAYTEGVNGAYDE